MASNTTLLSPSPVPQACGWEPAYLALYRSGELRARVEQTLESLRCCRVCPRNCDVNRLEDQYAFCKTGRHPVPEVPLPRAAGVDR